MYNVKGLLFLSLLFFQLIFICGQTDCTNIYYGNLCYPKIDTVKLNIYESILFSKEIKNDRKCHIVTIKPRALHTSYVQNYGFYKTKEVEDTTSVKNLRKKMPESYSIYSINDDLANSIESQEYLRYLNNIEREKSQDTLYVEKFLYEDICENSYDIIKIQAPLDSWAKVYEANILLNKASVIIPVIYESFIDKPKYLLYKIELYKGSTKVKSVKVVQLE
ncbi:hypothetical protein O2K51_07290 [Apibacter raozihei]|uniref:hypothetical protein n=1 Tax=Apibacter raozihei TaxID=2500547 RepID=UPI000FE2B179|nr:hypothetical protein [Apibacter raozihei]